ncbi:MAG: AAA family ATPase [Candidatus Micrarchaeaceae archaeon]
MLRSIQLKNWKSHNDTTIEFKKGVNVIVGIMGAGKSSVMDGISFGLFGTFPALARRRIKLSDIITNNLPQGQSAMVRIVFDAGEHTYSITRNISKKGADAILEKDGKYMQAQPERVNEEISSILKLDYQTFSRVVYSEQNNLEYFLDLGRSERKKQIDNMLGLDSFSIAEENATSLINSIKSSVKTGEDILSKFDFNSLRSKMVELNSQKSKYDAENAALNEEIKKLEESANEAKHALEAAKAEAAKKSALINEIAAIKSRISLFDSEIEKIKDMGLSKEKLSASISSLNLKIQELKAESIKLKEIEKSSISMLEKARADLSILKKRMDEMRSIEKSISGTDWASVAANIKTSEQKIFDTKGAISAIRSRIKDTKASMDELLSSSGRCPVCDQELTEEHKQSLMVSRAAEIKKMEEEEKNAISLLSSMQSEYDLMVKKYRDYELAKKRLSDYSGIEKALKENEETIPHLEETASMATSNLEKLISEQQKLVDELNTSKSNLEAIDRMEGYISKRAASVSELSIKEGQIASIKSDEKTVYSLQERFSSISSQLSAKKSELEGNKKLIAELSRSLSTVSSQIDEAEKLQRKIEAQRKASRDITIFKKVLSSVSAILRDKIVSSINGIMQGIWPTLYPYGDYTSVKLDAKEDDYSLQVLSPVLGGEWLEVDSIASGGEKSIACLAMRIALSMVIVPNLRWLILDEPTHNIDSSGISKLVDVLGDILPSIVEQVFIITHDDSLKQIHNAKIYSLERDKAAGNPTEVHEIQ